MQIQSNFMRYSITLRKFAKRAQTTFGAVAKGNLSPFGICLQKQEQVWLNTTFISQGSRSWDKLAVET